MDASDGMSIADQLASQQQQISVAEFFEQNRQMLGFGSDARSLVTTVKEAVDNAIDACEDAGILPTITVDITKTESGVLRVTVTDNGPGIKEEQIPKIFGKLLYGSRFSKRVQSRGQQGIGISAAVLYAQESTGKPAEITSKVAENESARHFAVRIDTEANEPEIINSSETPWPHDTGHGTSITLHIDGNFRARSRLHEYIKYTSIVNPHVTIQLTEPDHEYRSERTVDTLPEQPEEIRPHPHGIDMGQLRKLLSQTDSHTVSGFLQSEFTRVGQTTANDIIDEFKDRISGRHIRWNVPTPSSEHTLSNGVDGQATLPDTTHDDTTVTLTSHIAAHVNRKPRDVTEALSDGISNELHEQSPVSWVEVQDIVDTVSDTVEEDLDVTIGETVREKTADAAWTIITTTRAQTLEQILSTATSDRKTRSDIELVASQIARMIADDTGVPHDTYTKQDIQSIVEDAIDSVDTNLENSFGETAKTNIIDALWERMDTDPGDPPLIREISDDRDLIDDLHKAMQSVSVMAPPSHCLSPIGTESLEKGMRNEFAADFYSTSQRDAHSHSGEPFIVEAGIAYGGDIEQDGAIQLLRFANRVPLVYKKGACAITNTVSDIRWNNYKLSDKGGGLPQGPVVIAVHVASTNVPFTSESKDAVASVSIIEDEIERAVREVARDLKRHLKRQNTLQKQRRKRDKIDDILPEMASKVSNITGEPAASVTESVARIMNNVYVGYEDGDTQTRLIVRNYNDRKGFDLEVSLDVDSSPSGQSEDYSVTDTDDGIEVTVPITVAAGDSEEIRLDDVQSIYTTEIADIEDENVSVAE